MPDCSRWGGPGLAGGGIIVWKRVAVPAIPQEVTRVERTILPDCCEDWMLAYGAFYEPEAEFECVECATPWRKLERGRFQGVQNERVWVERSRDAEGQRFRYLEAEDGENALTERCCAKMILDYGERIRPGRQFTCPICRSVWRKSPVEHRSGLRVTGYENRTRGVTMAVQTGRGRNFLVPIEEYVPPRYE